MICNLGPEGGDWAKCRGGISFEFWEGGEDTRKSLVVNFLFLFFLEVMRVRAALSLQQAFRPIPATNPPRRVRNIRIISNRFEKEQLSVKRPDGGGVGSFRPNYSLEIVIIAKARTSVALMLQNRRLVRSRLRYRQLIMYKKKERIALWRESRIDFN